MNNLSKTQRFTNIKQAFDNGDLTWEEARNIRSFEFSLGKKKRSAKVIKFVNKSKVELLAFTTV